jgi:hypothetical protein
MIVAVQPHPTPPLDVGQLKASAAQPPAGAFHLAVGKKTGGRQKGTPNKLTSIAREAIELAAAKLGGAMRLAEWAKEDPANERAFRTSIYPKLLPLQLSGPNDGPVQFEITDEQRARALDSFLARNGLMISSKVAEEREVVPVV